MPQAKTATVEIFDRSRDVYGNPTAHYLIFADGETLRSKRREQVGYGDKTSQAALDALAQFFPRTVWKVSDAGINVTRSGASATFEAVRDYDREPVPVIFRAEKSGDFKGEVTACFPTLPGTNDANTFTTYAHVGQHGTGSRDWYKSTRPATPEEIEPLRRELTSAPFNYVLETRKKWLAEFDDERRAALV